jgi:hypothetical protein
MDEPVGTSCDAWAAFLYHNGIWLEDYDWRITLAGRGEDRYAYLIGDVVYKVGEKDTANRYDHATGAEARRRGYRWAPPASTLYEVPDLYADDQTVPVLAMPYLESDGTDADPELEAEMHQQAGEGRAPHCSRVDCWCRYAVDDTNYVVIGGQPVVIDCCTVSLPWVEGDSRAVA